MGLPGKIRKALSSTIQSVNDSRWYYYSDPFIFHDIWRRKKTGLLLSDKAIIKGRTLAEPPPYFKAFCPNKKLFMAELCTRMQGEPIQYHEIYDQSTKYQLSRLKDAFAEVLPTDLIGSWRALVRRFKKYRTWIRFFCGRKNLETREEFKAFISALEETLLDLESSEQQPTYEEDSDVDGRVADLLIRFGDEQVYRRLIRSEYTLDELLDEEESDNFSLPSFEDGVLSDIEDEMNFVSEDDSDLEENPGLNETRRIQRQGFSVI